MHPSPRHATPAGAPAPPSRLKAAVFAGFTALALVVLPVAYWFNRTARADRDLSHQVEHTVEEVSSHLQLKLKAIELVLRGVRGFVEGSDVVTADEFHAFVASLQRALKARGFYLQPLTGVLDAHTSEAVRRFQADRGLDSLRLSLAAARELGIVSTDLDQL